MRSPPAFDNVKTRALGAGLCVSTCTKACRYGGLSVTSLENVSELEVHIETEIPGHEAKDSIDEGVGAHREVS